MSDGTLHFMSGLLNLVMEKYLELIGIWLNREVDSLWRPLSWDIDRIRELVLYIYYRVSSHFNFQKETTSP